jgi:predicted house-cleaning noncanonical NTP pyrophosphatase (MazG superfamily)
MGKLVRDKIPEIMIANKQLHKIRIIKDNKEYFNELIKKLLEETNEFIEAAQTNDSIEAQNEIADIFEVIETICDFKKYNKDAIQDYKAQKRRDRGGFKKKIFLEN